MFWIWSARKASVPSLRMCDEFNELPNSSLPAPLGSTRPGAASPSRAAAVVLTPSYLKTTSSVVVGPPERRLPKTYWALSLMPQSESMKP